MNRHLQIRLLIGALLLLAVVVYVEMRSAAVRGRRPPSEGFDLLQVDNPALRVDLLERSKQLNYDGSHRNIFSASLPPPSTAEVQRPANVAATPPAPPPGPPPLVVPAQFFGYVTDAQTGVRRAFFNQDQDAYVLGVGELLVGRFRVVQIGDSSAELEETATGRRANLTLEDAPGQLGENRVDFAQAPNAVGSSPPGFRPSPFGQQQVGFTQTPGRGRPSLLDFALGHAPAVVNPPR